MHIDVHFIAALIALIVSEAIPVITRSRFGGILHAAVVLVGKLYSSPGDVEGLSAQVSQLREEIEKLKGVRQQIDDIGGDKPDANRAAL